MVLHHSMELSEMVLHHFWEVLMSLHKKIIILKLTKVHQLRTFPETVFNQKVSVFSCLYQLD